MKSGGGWTGLANLLTLKLLTMGKFELSEAAKQERRKYKRQWAAKNREKLNAYQREWAKKNPDKIKKIHQRYWERKAQKSEK